MSQRRQIAVLGAGSWGTTLALVAARAGHEVRLWDREPTRAARLAEDREHRERLPGFPFPSCLEPTGDLGQAVAGAEMIVTAIPSAGIRALYQRIAPLLDPETLLINASKGLEAETGQRTAEIVEEVMRGQFPPRYLVLSGPSFALEVAREEPTALVVASASLGWATTVQETLSTRQFRLYTSRDVVGVEIGGALKNVMALATGAVHGLGLGYNTTAALVTRGLAEMTRLATRLGGHPETLAGLAGMGDLVLTCFGHLSRNRHVGVELGRGRRLPEILAGMREVAEGVGTANAACQLAHRHGVEMPITAAVQRLLSEEVSPRQLVEDLMDRPLKSESN
jgi:glycerol-3-phosphate dehydrogenase (NAD(P)+)